MVEFSNSDTFVKIETKLVESRNLKKKKINEQETEEEKESLKIEKQKTE